MTHLEHLERLCSLRGVSGDEARVAEYIAAQIDGHCQWKMDALGNILAFKKGKIQPKNKVMLCAPMDEAGFIVTGHTDEGLLRFTPVGDVDSRVIIGKPVLAGDAGLPGVIGAKAVHMMTSEEKDTPLGPDKLLIDLGFSTREEAQSAVQTGERVVFHSAFGPFGEGLLSGRAVAERAACTVLISLLQGEMEYDTAFVFAVQSVTGGVGARAAAFSVSPDCALIVEPATAADVSGVPVEKQMCVLGGGAVLTFLDQGALYDIPLYRLGLQAAAEAGIAAQSRLGVPEGGMARAIVPASGGVRCASVGIPCRYPHTPSSVVSTADLCSTRELLRVFAQQAAQL